MKWQQISPYCLRNGEWTIAKIGGSRGWTYELYRAAENIGVGMRSAEEAMRMHEHISSMLGDTPMPYERAT